LVLFNTFVRVKKTFSSLFAAGLLFGSMSAWAQTQKQLPEVSLRNQDAEIRLEWYCQYDGVKSISIQRSADSVRNFSTLGILNTPKKGNQSYLDPHPMVGNNYYRLYIAFNSDLEWYSNTYKSVLDSATVARVAAAKAEALAKIEAEKLAIAAKKAEAARKADSIKAELQKQAEIARKADSMALDIRKQAEASKKSELLRAELARAEAEKAEAQRVENQRIEMAKRNETLPKPTKPENNSTFSFTPNDKIFTDAISGHIKIKLDDALSHRYTIRFYDPVKNEVLRISRISKTLLILDKNNFNSRGIYSFQLFDGSNPLDTGYITVN
jgi:hypothetical protein